MLIRAGEALYGLRWQSELARDLGVLPRSMRRYLAGRELPEGAEETVRKLLEARATRIAELLKRF
jgi:hypothetical protein